MKLKLKLTALVFFATTCNAVFAQRGDTLEVHKSKYNIVKLARFKPDNSGERKMQDAEKFLYKILKANVSDELVLIKSSTDNLGIGHKAFQQRFKGIPVEGAIYHAHGKNGSIEIINGDFIPINLVSVTPSITE